MAFPGSGGLQTPRDCVRGTTKDENEHIVHEREEKRVKMDRGREGNGRNRGWRVCALSKLMGIGLRQREPVNGFK